MSRDRTKGRERGWSYEHAPHSDIREKVLDELTDLYVQDKISLEQYESLAAEIQKADDPQAVLHAALTAHRASDMDGRAERRDVQHDQDGSSSAYRRPLSPDSVNPMDSLLGPWGRSGDFFLCVMGDRRVNGRMLEGKAATSVTLMGSTTIDLRGIQVPAAGLRLELVAIMGETRILVSPGTRVHFSVVPIMGEAVSRADVPFDASREGVLQVSGIALMGSVSVRVVP
jgi:hypothetical protein